MSKIYIRTMTNDFADKVNKSLKNNPALTQLESVGTFLDESNCTIFPALDSGFCDYENPTVLSEEKVSEDWWNALSDKDFTHMKRMKINTVKLKGILDNKVNTPAKVKRTHLISVNDEELEHLCIILYETPLFEKACENWDDESVQLHKDLYNKLQTIINNNR